MFMIVRVLVWLVLCSAWGVSAQPSYSEDSSNHVEEVVRFEQEQGLGNRNPGCAWAIMKRMAPALPAGQARFIRPLSFCLTPVQLIQRQS